MKTRKLWYRQVNEHEFRRARSDRCLGPGWYELGRDLVRGETVQIVDGRAEIVAAPEHGADRRAAVATALPDILLAVADGADLADEVRKALAKAEGTHGNR